MVRDTYAYRQVAVESRLVGAAVRIRPVPGQAFSPALTVQCARRLSDTSLYPLGTTFLLAAKLTDRLGGTPFLYAYHGDADVVLSPKQAKAFLAEFKRGRI
ncbi:hypothetical protein ACFDR9_000809 [Janthinobacterium sp. CG_23.3]|uniref:hypothetical protein n=1 Tax=unclassified Janthinobacterium TaxID=2610881 RepID=UPI0003475632|nr:MULTISPECIES: hypothetical protein [unclassified Janthinobacterium]MEC5159309.1 hypothetical protein [Janthinobacterium sp. CG_S6]